MVIQFIVLIRHHNLCRMSNKYPTSTRLVHDRLRVEIKTCQCESFKFVTNLITKQHSYLLDE